MPPFPGTVTGPFLQATETEPTVCNKTAYARFSFREMAIGTQKVAKSHSSYEMIGTMPLRKSLDLPRIIAL